jgi:ferredoxin
MDEKPKVWITPGCITCGRCEFLVPEIFEVTDVARVKDTIDAQKHEAAIKQAALTCPVQVIKCDLENKNSSELK